MENSGFFLEEAFQELDKIIGQMGNQELSLADSMDLYKKGVKLLSQCRETLENTEKELIILKEENMALERQTAGED